MANDSRCAGYLPVAFLLAIALCTALFTMPASAADAEIEAFMGDTVTISGISYVSDEMYLFLTGEGLDTNGVTLTDTSQHADEGDFTVVDVNVDQTWSYRWDTSQVSRSIDPGVYTVYATTEPVDRANLGGSGTYKTVEVWLKDRDAALRASSGASYTLNPEKHTSTTVQTLVFMSPTPTPIPRTPALPTTVLTTETTVNTTVITPVLSASQPTPTQQSANLPVPSLLVALGGITISLAIARGRRKNEK